MAAPIFVYSDALMGYDMGPQHPMNPRRLRMTYDLLDSYGVFGDRLTCVRPIPIERDELLETHSEAFIDVLEQLEEGVAFPGAARYGFGSRDIPIFEGVHSAACLYTGASAQAAQAVLDGDSVAFNISGGLHHAHYGRAAGFCVLNDCAVAVHRLRLKYARVAYVDIDVHHGDGVQELFYTDPDVLTISLHQSGRTLFPGTGFPDEIGQGAGRGYSVNLPFAPYTDDTIWLDAWRSAALPILRAFDPEAIVLQMGADAHFRDPLAHLCVTAQGWAEAIKDVLELGKPIVALGGGGYNLKTVTRMWALGVSVLAGLDLPDETPAAWAEAETIPTLTDHVTLQIEARERARTAAGANSSVEQLKLLLGPRFGLR